MEPIARIPVETGTRSPAGRTNAYVIGAENAVLVDPAGVTPELDRILEERSPSRLVVTHAHSDHVGGVAHYADALDLDVLARAGYERRFEAATGIAPDRTLRDGDALAAGARRVTVTAMPGHAPDHVALSVRAGATDRDAILVGDLAVAEGSVVVDPDEGDMRGYVTALHRLHARNPVRLLPGHGPEIDDPRATLSRLLAHRLRRERRVLAAVRAGAATPREIVDAAYDKDLAGVRDLARATVVAHLEKLAVEGAIAWDGERARPA